MQVAGTATGEFTGKMVGDEDEIAKAAPSGLLTKAAGADDDFVNVDLPKGASISISPADFAKLRTFKQELVTKTAAVAEEREDAAVKAIAAAEAPVYKRDIDTADAPQARQLRATRSRTLSYPIENAGDLDNAAILARSGHGDVAAARRLIARRAGELGVANPLDESDEANKSETADPR